MSMFAVNPWDVIAAAAVGWLAGLAYYTLLAERWVTALGTSMEHLRRERAAKAGTVAAWGPFALAFLAELVMAWALAWILLNMDIATVETGVIVGALIWLGLIATTLSVNNMFGGRKFALTVIDGGHWLLVLALMGAVLGATG